MEKENSPSSIAKILYLVEIFLAHSEGISPQEILEQIELSRSSLYSTLAVLKGLGYIEQPEPRGKYFSGPRLQAWRVFSGDFRQELIAGFNQEAARSRLPETLLLLIPVQGGMQVLQQSEGIETVRSVYKTGAIIKDFKTADLIFKLPTSIDIFTNGYCQFEKDSILELCIPICPDGFTPKAAILLSAPTFRWNAAQFTDKFITPLRLIAAHLSYRLGALTYTPYHSTGIQEYPQTVELSSADIHAFLQGPYTASLACVRPDGLPHVIPVWQEWDGKGFTIVAWKGSIWAHFIQENPNISLTIDEPWPPLRRLTARGEARRLPFEPDSRELADLTERLSQRYLGDAHAAISRTRIDEAFRIEIQSLKGWQGLPGNSISSKESRP